MDELKACPFCGGYADVLKSYRYDIEEMRFFVACSVCGVETPRIARTRSEAVKAWQRRVQPTNTRPVALCKAIPYKQEKEGDWE